jgi:threonine dehydrogenase-like Zn-dependent dehydrogenase
MNPADAQRSAPVEIPDRAPAPRFTGRGQIDAWEREVPRPGPGELLLAIRANAICGSDRHQWDEGSDVVPGHEAAGVVIAAGDRTATPIGTPGVVFLMDFCGECRSCRAGATNQCFAKRADMGFTRDGGYGPFELIHESNFFPVPDDLPLAEATLLLDVMGTTGHAIDRARLLVPEIRSVAVSGAGPLGLGFTVVARLLLGPDVPVVIADVQPARLALVEDLGGRTVDLRRGSLAEGLRVHGLVDVDVAIDTAGRAVSRRALLDVSAKRGVVVCVGHGEGLDLTVSQDLIAPERGILGSEYFRFDEFPRNLALLLAHRDELTPIISHCFPVVELAHAFELFMSGATGKVVVEQ